MQPSSEIGRVFPRQNAITVFNEQNAKPKRSSKSQNQNAGLKHSQKEKCNQEYARETKPNDELFTKKSLKTTLLNVPACSTTIKLKEEAEAENQEFFNQVDSTMKAIIKELVKAQVSKIMPQIKKYVTVSLGAKVLVRSTNQPQTSYTVAASLSEFELKKILIEKMKTNKSINRLDIQKNLYNALLEAYNSEKDIITSYGDVVTLKRGRDDQGKDEDPFAGSDRWTKRRKSSKDAEPSEG
uniref:Uncharacterized protein n=1 Tax=Tanacetum cinerariifolium TaxID=118510 RepID=A0A6L2M633_TANCI|nr:hypothetical protein [Tanacetum cinerariifolium]